MKQTLEYRPDLDPPFWLQYGDTGRPCTMIQVWNLGVREESIRAALLRPSERINIEKSAATCAMSSKQAEY